MSGAPAPAAPRSIAILGDTREAHALRLALRASQGRLQVTEALADAALAIDATHPFDDEFAGEPQPPRLAALRAEGRALRLLRPPWRPGAGDDWRVVDTPEAAFAALEPAWRRVFLALGRNRIAPFRTDQARWYLTRVRNAPADLRLTPRGAVTATPGPYSVADETDLLTAHRIEALVCRNVGGAGAFPKIAAARRLGLPVVMLTPPPPAPPTTHSVAEALAWIERTG
jgi:precorrin-6A/cobalt-precorrin-6A reductase